MKINLTPLEVVFFVAVSGGIWVWARFGRRIRRWWREWRKRRWGSWQLRPREPGDCPQCAKAMERLPQRVRGEIEPWWKLKSAAGHPKVIDSRGYACQNEECMFYGNTDPTEHALVSDGKREGVQYWRCQLCGGCRTMYYGTVMYRLKTPVTQVERVMTALSEGVDIAAASRIFGHHPKTIGRWLYQS